MYFVRWKLSRFLFDSYRHPCYDTLYPFCPPGEKAEHPSHRFPVLTLLSVHRYNSKPHFITDQHNIRNRQKDCFQNRKYLFSSILFLTCSDKQMQSVYDFYLSVNLSLSQGCQITSIYNIMFRYGNMPVFPLFLCIIQFSLKTATNQKLHRYPATPANHTNKSSYTVTNQPARSPVRPPKDRRAIWI